MKNAKFYKNEKFIKIFYAVLTFLAVSIFVTSGILAFEKLYYENIYVSGSSMMPTLIGGDEEGRHHYGKADKSKRTLDNLNRFDVAITYYPSDWLDGNNETYIIKRVWGFPGEVLNLTYTATEYTFTVSDKDGNEKEKYVAEITTRKVKNSDWSVALFNTTYRTFSTHLAQYRKLVNYVLRDGEYFLMGDNWGASTDSYDMKDKKTTYVTRDLLQGKVVSIDGTARIVDNKLVDKQKIEGMFNF